MEERVVIVTGASSGIGEATAMALAERGARLVLGARRLERLQALQAKIEAAGGEAIVCATDVTVRQDVERLASAAIERWGRIDVLINIAGVLPLTHIRDLRVEEWEHTIDVNFKGVLYGVAAVLDTMRAQGGGHIINVSSVAGRRVFPTGSVYCATKFAVNAFSAGLRMELTPTDKIKVTMIEPGVVATELPDIISDPSIAEQRGAALEQMRPLRSEDVARTIVFAIDQPSHVDIHELLIMPTDQKG